VEIPKRIEEGFSRLWNEFSEKIGLEKFTAMMQIVPGDPNFLIYVENPIREFSGITLPQWRVDLDLAELAQERWVSPLRMMLLFIVVCMFISSVITVLRKV